MGLTKKNMYEQKPVEPVKVQEEPPAPVALPSTIEFSFDDGYKDDLRIASILEQYGLRGTFYIIIDAVGRPGFMNWEDIKDLDRRGHEIGSHTVTHPADLKKLYDEELFVEVQNSKDMLEMVLGHTVKKFCYPRGRLDERVEHTVNQAGYVHARVTGEVGNTVLEDNLRAPGTIQIYPREKYGELSIVDYAKKTIDKVKANGGYCNVWGHAKEIRELNLWNDLEEICKYATGK